MFFFLTSFFLFFSFLLPYNCVKAATDIQKIRMQKCESVITTYFFEDLDTATEYNRFYDYTSESNLSKNLHTLFGKIILQKIVTQKKITTKNLKERDLFLETLIHNPSIMLSLEELLKELEEAQHIFLAYIDEDMPEHEKLSSCYFNSFLADYGFNKSPAALTAKHYIDKTVFLATTGLIAYAPLFFGAAFNYRIAQIRTEKDNRDSSIAWSKIIKDSFMLPLRSLDPRINVYKNGYFSSKVTDKSALTKGDQAVCWSQDYELPLSLGYIACYAQAIGLINSGCTTIKNSYNYLAFRNKQLATVTHDLTILQNLMEKTYAFTSLKSISISKNKDIGSALIMHNTFKKNKEELLAFFKTIGELDAYHALARSMIDARDAIND